MQETNNTISIFIESPDGERFECDVPVDLQLNKLATDFFEAKDWPTTDSQGRGQRAVVEVVDPDEPERTKRLRGEQTVDETGLGDGSILRIFPEAIAGAIDERKRIRALITDRQELKDLVEWNTKIHFSANIDHAPTQYTITFDHKSFTGIEADGHTPRIGTGHQVQITMGADYPINAPRVEWLTEIFHPNIHPQNGAVCLGVLQDRYLPGLGLARLVTMLAEMVQYRNFDMSSPLNKQAAEWTMDPNHWPFIQAIGGSPFQGPVHELLKQFETEWQRPRIQFTPTRRQGNTQP